MPKNCLLLDEVLSCFYFIDLVFLWFSFDKESNPKMFMMIILTKLILSFLL